MVHAGKPTCRKPWVSPFLVDDLGNLAKKVVVKNKEVINSMERLFIVALSGILFSCASSEPPPAESPTGGSAIQEEPEAKAAEAAEPASEASPPDQDATAEAAPEVTEEEPSGPKPTRPPAEILTAPDVVFMFSFKQSDVQAKAEKKCEELAAGDPQKRVECMRRERDELSVDSMRFVKDEAGNVKWITFRKKGSTLFEQSNVSVDFQDETETSVVVVPRSKHRQKQKIEVPNDFSIEIEDPKHGTIVYEAKIGIVGE